MALQYVFPARVPGRLSPEMLKEAPRDLKAISAFAATNWHWPGQGAGFACMFYKILNGF